MKLALLFIGCFIIGLVAYCTLPDPWDFITAGTLGGAIGVLTTRREK